MNELPAKSPTTKAEKFLAKLIKKLPHNSISDVSTVQLFKSILSQIDATNSIRTVIESSLDHFFDIFRQLLAAKSTDGPSENLKSSQRPRQIKHHKLIFDSSIAQYLLRNINDKNSELEVQRLTSFEDLTQILPSLFFSESRTKDILPGLVNAIRHGWPHHHLGKIVDALSFRIPSLLAVETEPSEAMSFLWALCQTKSEQINERRNSQAMTLFLHDQPTCLFLCVGYLGYWEFNFDDKFSGNAAGKKSLMLTQNSRGAWVPVISEVLALSLQKNLTKGGKSSQQQATPNLYGNIDVDSPNLGRDIVHLLMGAAWAILHLEALENKGKSSQRSPSPALAPIAISSTSAADERNLRLFIQIVMKCLRRRCEGNSKLLWKQLLYPLLSAYFDDKGKSDSKQEPGAGLDVSLVTPEFVQWFAHTEIVLMAAHRALEAWALESTHSSSDTVQTSDSGQGSGGADGADPSQSPLKEKHSPRAHEAVGLGFEAYGDDGDGAILGQDSDEEEIAFMMDLRGTSSVFDSLERVELHTDAHLTTAASGSGSVDSEAGAVYSVSSDSLLLQMREQHQAASAGVDDDYGGNEACTKEVPDQQPSSSSSSSSTKKKRKSVKGSVSSEAIVIDTVTAEHESATPAEGAALLSVSSVPLLLRSDDAGMDADIPGETPPQGGEGAPQSIRKSKRRKA